MEMFLAGLAIIGLFSMLPIAIGGILLYEDRSKKTHKENHPGLTINTLCGKKDIYCPRCQSPYCHYYYETNIVPSTYYYKTKVHLFNPFKPLIEEKVYELPGFSYNKKKFRCFECGKIFT